jgi:hypothetical protein
MQCWPSVCAGSTTKEPVDDAVTVVCVCAWVYAARSTTTGPAAAKAAAEERRKIIIELEEEETLGAGGWRTCGKWVVAGVCEWVRRFMISQKN